MPKTHIIIHHSLTKDSETVSWGAIRKYHIETNGWHDIGYHFGIELIGDHYEILIGRLLDYQGAHCPQQNMNNLAFGICCVGNFDEAAPSNEMWDTCLELTLSLMRTFNIPAKNVLGHHELNPAKTCPGLKWDMAKFRTELRRW